MSKWLMLSFFLTLLLSACDLLKAGAGTPQKTSSQPAKALTAEQASRKLDFLREGKPLKDDTIGALATTHGVEEWSAYDPYYDKTKRWKTIKLLPILEEVFGVPASELRDKSFIMRASDGYSVTITGEQLVTDDAYLAIEDLDFPEWELTPKEKSNPGPVYMVWRNEAHHDLHKWPRPWQLSQIELASFEQTYARVIPNELVANSPEAHGFEIFKAQCIRCHAINQHGGQVGPELNVPQNITEYRPIEQIKAYIKNPKTFRYGNMPAFEHLSDKDIDGVVAYLTLMKDQKQDPAQGPL